MKKRWKVMLRSDDGSEQAWFFDAVSKVDARKQAEKRRVFDHWRKQGGCRVNISTIENYRQRCNNSESNIHPYLQAHWSGYL
jgi:hypothetical protein